ncbi:MAG: hypothetical protein HXY25_05990, partial [Alphaproteobacteria bacterium]|nr:hypothetical protein [Alphaproteobacteria bacterium]
PPAPSATDAASPGEPGLVWIIAGLAGAGAPRLGAFQRRAEGGFAPLALEIV